MTSNLEFLKVDFELFLFCFGVCVFFLLLILLLLAPTNVMCGVNQIPCHSGECVPSEARCNGIYECADQSDEAGCGMFYFAFFIFLDLVQKVVVHIFRVGDGM